MQVLEVTGEDAFLCSKEIRVDAAKVLHLPRNRVVVQQVGEDPADLFESQQCGHFSNLILVRVFQQFYSVSSALLRRLIDGDDASPNAERNVGRDFICTVQEADALMTSDAPVIQEFIDNPVVLKHDVIDVSVSLSVQSDCRRLTLGADAFRPWRMITAAGFDFAVHVFEGDVLPASHSGRHLTKIRVERKMFDLLLLQISFVVRFNR